MEFPSTKDYPKEELNGRKKLCPISLTYGILIQAKSKCHDNVMSGRWNDANGREYLHVLGINDRLISNILKHAKNSRIRTLVEKTDSKNLNQYMSLTNDINNHPETYQEYPHPPFWNSTMDFCQSIDALMHLLFLGIVKLCIKMFNTWIPLFDRSAFLNYSENILDPIIKFNLDFCVILGIKWNTKKATTGWVSENYLGFCRIIKWYFHGINLFKVDQGRILQNKHLHTWKKAELEEWLKQNNTDFKGNRADLLNKVKDLMMKDIHEGSSRQDIYTPSSFHDLMSSLLAMVSLSMSLNVTKHTVSLLQSHIKLFLNQFHGMQLVVNRKKKRINDKINTQKSKETLPIWLTSYNCLSLLNLPSIMSEFGPFPPLWEGGNQGEGYLREAKPHVCKMSKNWAVNMHNTLAKRAAISLICPKDQGKVSTISSKYYMYPSLIDIIMSIKTNHPLAGLYFSAFKTFGAVVKRQSTPAFVPFTMHMESKKEKFGMVFYKVNYVAKSVEDLPLLSEYFKQSDVEFCLFLPELNEDGYLVEESTSYYYIISSNWMEFKVDVFVIILLLV